MFDSKKWLAVTAVGLVLSACAGSSNMVVEPNRTSFKAQSVQLAYDGGTVGVPDEAVAELKRYMEERFFKAGAAFGRGDQLTVKYGYMGYDEGSQAARYFLGGLGGGEAKMVIGAQFIGPDGQVLAKIQSEGRLAGGLFGGDASQAIQKAAQEIGDYAEANFRQ